MMQRASATLWKPDEQQVKERLLETVENMRRHLSERVERQRRARMGQFFTQISATDLRALRYPARDQLVWIGQHIGQTFPDQTEVDRLVTEVVSYG